MPRLKAKLPLKNLYNHRKEIHLELSLPSVENYSETSIKWTPSQVST